jgi:hypothetical protein
VVLEQLAADEVSWIQLASAPLGTLPVTSTAADYDYAGNGGVFGNSAVYSSLHASPTSVDGILHGDNFANNDNDLAAGNVHQADYLAGFSGLTGAGTYKITVSGVIKGNSATAVAGFAVSSNIIVIGGCSCSQ